MERIEQEWAIASRNQRPFAFLMIDIDAFKQVNDVHGHEVGDQVLSKVAALLRQTARIEDVVGRPGGEEFVVACPGAIPERRPQNKKAPACRGFFQTRSGA